MRCGGLKISVQFTHKAERASGKDGNFSADDGKPQKERLKGEDMKATLRKMGMDFLNNENGSDIGNYRVRAKFTDKNGINIVADFGGYDHREVYQKQNGETACKVAQKNALHIDGCYRDENGAGRDYAYKLKESGLDFAKYYFTISGILAFLSDVTGTNYTEIEFIN